MFALQNFAKALSSIFLGTTVIPRRNQKDYAKFWGADKVYNGRCANGE